LSLIIPQIFRDSCESRHYPAAVQKFERVEIMVLLCSCLPARCWTEGVTQTATAAIAGVTQAIYLGSENYWQTPLDDPYGKSNNFSLTLERLPG